jgi:hypothetical protein
MYNVKAVCNEWDNFKTKKLCIAYICAHLNEKYFLNFKLSLLFTNILLCTSRLHVIGISLLLPFT